jgi:FkbM family methyltransferase
MINKKIITELLDMQTLTVEQRRYLERFIKNKSTALAGWSPSFLRKLDEIQTIIDVGVLDGTPSLYKAFPESNLILIEALPEYSGACEKIVGDHPGGGKYFMVAAGDSDSFLEFYRLRDSRRSSALKSVISPAMEAEKIRVPVRRLDTLLPSEPLKGNVLLKIDTEGFELQVLSGSIGLLPKIKWIIAETSVRLRHQESYRFADLACFMRDQGFCFYDALTLTRSKSMLPGASIMDSIWVNEKLV